MHPVGRLDSLVQTVLPHLTTLRSLDLGEHTGAGLPLWQITPTPSSLLYLRVPVQDMTQLHELMSLESLSSTVEQFHVTMRSQHCIPDDYPMALNLPMELDLSMELALHPMTHLHTFVFIQSIFAWSSIGWSTIEHFTISNVMPVLRQVKLAMLITVDELDSINRSSLFTDDRRVDVHFAFIIKETTLDLPSRQAMLHASRSHPREVVRARCLISQLNLAHRELTNYDCYVSHLLLSFTSNEMTFVILVRRSSISL